MLETILQEIRDELRRSNDLKSKQLQDFTNTAEEPAGWTQLPAEPKEDEAPAKEEPKQEEAPAKEEPKEDEAPAKEEPKQEEAPATANVPDEATFKKEIAKVIKGGTKKEINKLKAKIKKTGATKVNEVPAESRQSILDYTESLHWLD